MTISACQYFYALSDGNSGSTILLLWRRISIYLASVIHFKSLVEGDLKAPFSIATTPGVREGASPFPGLLHFTLDPYHVMLSVKKGGIKYHSLSLWYDSIWDWNPVSRTIGETFFYLPMLFKRVSSKIKGGNYFFCLNSHY